MNKTDRAWAEVNLDAVRHNMAEIRKTVGNNVKIMAMVKSDAYGHGIEKIAKTVVECGADYLGVACPWEAMELISKNISAKILIVGYSAKEKVSELIENDVEMTVFDTSDAEFINNEAEKLSKKAKIHIKLDTGMSRIGIPAYSEDVIDVIKKIADLQNIEICGIFTHLATADEENAEGAKKQFELFLKVTDLLEKEGIQIPIKHAANSAATLLYKDMHLDMVRPGICIYGAYPSEYVKNNTKASLREAMALKSRIIRIETLKKGTPVSYGGTYITQKEEKTATISIGYGDGYTRSMSNCAPVFSNGKYGKIIGRVCMDQCMANIDGIDAQKEDEVVLFGENIISVEEIAKLCRTISYEVYCGISKRIPRIYTGD